MMDFADDLERRQHPRWRRRLPCKLLVGGRARKGLVRDVSAGGLFVHTQRPLGADQGLVVVVHAPEGQRFVLAADVPHRNHLPQSLASHAPSGAGLRLHDPPDAYRRWVEEREEKAP